MPEDLFFSAPDTINISTVEGDVYIGCGAGGSQVVTGASPDEPGKTSVIVTPVPVRGGAGGIVGGGIRCTKDVRPCPDGSYVARTGPDCNFPPCPSGDISGELNDIIMGARRYMVSGILEQYLSGVATGALIYNGVSRIEEAVGRFRDVSEQISAIPPYQPSDVLTVRPSVAVISFSLGTVPPTVSAEKFRLSYNGGFTVIAQPDPSKVFLQVPAGREGEILQQVILASSDPAVGAEPILSFQNA